jgi:MSHA biogenesis protein MshK
MSAGIYRRALTVLWCAFALFPAAAGAQAFSDPTRPPANFGGASDPDADGGGGTVLQSVIISPTGKAAIISGVVVKLGEKYGDAVLVKVAESEVVLKTGTTSQTLKLLPGVEKRESSAASRSGARKGKGRGPAAAADGGAASQ